MTLIHKAYSFATLLLIWFLLSSIFSPSVVPGPVVVAKAVVEDLGTGEPFFHIYKTMMRVGLGLGLAMLFGLVIGLVMGLSRKGEMFFDSWVMIGSLPTGVSATFRITPRGSPLVAAGPVVVWAHVEKVAPIG